MENYIVIAEELETTLDYLLLGRENFNIETIELLNTVPKAGVRGSVGYIPRKSKVMEKIDLAIIKEFQLEDTINKILKGELKLYEKTKEREADKQNSNG